MLEEKLSHLLHRLWNSFPTSVELIRRKGSLISPASKNRYFGGHALILTVGILIYGCHRLLIFTHQVSLLLITSAVPLADRFIEL